VLPAAPDSDAACSVLSAAPDSRGSFLHLAGGKGESAHPKPRGGATVAGEYSVSEREPVRIGQLRPGTEWLSLARIMLWWLAPHWGRVGVDDIPLETSFLLVRMAANASSPQGAGPGPVRACASDYTYALFLPLPGNMTRTALSGSREDLCLHVEEWQDAGESPDSCAAKDENSEQGTGGQEGERRLENVLFVATGTDPFALVRSAFMLVADRLQTFRPLCEKMLPRMLDVFGWCTWDAFYSAITSQKSALL
jgi:hypothetical protein